MILHVLTGDGKGKTTAAVGMAVRAKGSGKQVLFLQFLKDGTGSEIKPLLKIGVDVKAFGRGRFISPATAVDHDRTLAWEGLDFLKRNQKRYDVVICDEILNALGVGLITIEDISNAFNPEVECDIVLTGRGAPQNLIELADYVSEVQKIKHPFDDGVEARGGIEF